MALATQTRGMQAGGFFAVEDIGMQERNIWYRDRTAADTLQRQMADLIQRRVQPEYFPAIRVHAPLGATDHSVQH
jgi:hypothetical protein